LQTYEGLRRLLGILAPMAVRLLQLRTAARASPELPASQTMPDEVVQVVAYLAKVPASSLSTKQCWYTIAAEARLSRTQWGRSSRLENPLVRLALYSDPIARHPSGLLSSFPISLFM
jgi:hypothetical protein